MGSETPIRNQFGTIIGLQPKDETEHVQATLDASMQAVGAIPEVRPHPHRQRSGLFHHRRHCE